MKYPGKSNLLLINFEKIEQHLENIFLKQIEFGPGKDMLKKLSSNTGIFIFSNISTQLE